MINLATTAAKNPDKTTELIKNIIFWGNKIDNYIVAQFNKILPLNDIQNNILLYTIYLVILFFVIKSAERIKPVIKIGIIALLLFLLIGFFKF